MTSNDESQRSPESLQHAIDGIRQESAPAREVDAAARRVHAELEKRHEDAGSGPRPLLATEAAGSIGGCADFVSLVPAYLENLNRILPKGEVLPVPILSSATFGPPVQLADGEDKSSFLSRARDAVVRLRPA